MGIGLVDPDATHRAILVAAALLGLSGLAALSLVEGGTNGQPSRMVAPTHAGSPAPTYVDLVDDTTTTSLRGRTRVTWALGDRMDVRRGYAGPAQPPSGPGETHPSTQVDVAVPAAGAQVSAGEGEDSCTTVQMTALTPEGCPPPSGDGPVVVGYSGDGPDPDLDNLGRQDAAFA